MKIRIQESERLDIFTVQEFLNNADRQANFHPDARWVLTYKLGTRAGPSLSDNNEKTMASIIDIEVKWIGRESVVMWLISNQIKFQVLTYDLLKDEQEALDEHAHTEIYNTQTHVN